MRTVLVAQEAFGSTRLRLMARSLSRKFDVSIIKPLITTRRLGRVPSAGLRYFATSIQTALVQCDVYHALSSSDFIHLPVLAKQCALCYDYRSNYSEKLRMSFPAIASTAEMVEKLLLARAQVVLTVNDILGERLVKFTAAPILVISNYPSKTFRPILGREKTRERLNLKGHVALFVGSLTNTYDFGLILQAALRLPEVTFLIAGTGRYEGWIKTSMPMNVRLLGAVPHNNVPDLIDAADVCLAPVKNYSVKPVSNHQDVWKVSEYASLRKPIVATGLAPSDQYFLASTGEDFVEGILRGISGQLKGSEPSFWEDHSEPTLFKAYSVLR